MIRKLRKFWRLAAILAVFVIAVPLHYLWKAFGARSPWPRLFLGFVGRRFGLRVRWTWLSMVGLLALTLIVTTAFDVDGLPALPAIAVGFLLPNADLLWKAWRERGLEWRSG